MRQLVDVDAARRDVGGHQHAQLAALEVGQRLGARALALVAVDRHRGNAGLVQVLAQAVGAVLHAGEHQHLVPVLRLDQMDQQILLLLAADGDDALRDRLGSGVAPRHLDDTRLVQQPLGQRLDLVAEGGREQQALLLLGQDRQHLLDVVHEAHVEHAVGLVEHEELDAAQVQRALAVVVEQPARRGHQDVDAALEAVDLRAHADAAEHHHARELEMLAVVAHALLDLGGEFAGGGEDQRADRPAALAVLDRMARGQAVQQRQREACRLAGAGLRAGEQIAAGENRGNRLLLDRGGGVVALFADGAKEGLGQAQFVKRHEEAPG